MTSNLTKMFVYLYLARFAKLFIPTLHGLPCNILDIPLQEGKIIYILIIMFIVSNQI